jgi:hypothetical protein
MAVDAAAVVGKGKEGDYVLSPATHADEFRESAPELAELLSDSGVQHLAGEYQRADIAAVAAQGRFKRWMAAANWLVLVTAVLGASIMVVSMLSALLGEATAPLLTTLAVLGGASGASAAGTLFMVKQGQLLEGWMTARARAETMRLDYFTAVTGETSDPVDVGLEQLKLEYFRRFQLDLQVEYYDKRGAKHRAEAERTLFLAAAAMVLAAMASVLVAVLGQLATEWAAFGALAVLGTALQAFAASREGLGQDRRNAERYGRTEEALRQLRARLDVVRKSVATGAHPVLVEFVAAVQDQISLEHRDWLESAEATRASVERLEHALENASRLPEDGKAIATPAPLAGSGPAATPRPERAAP